jgi:hypothetical protein
MVLMQGPWFSWFEAFPAANCRVSACCYGSTDIPPFFISTAVRDNKATRSMNVFLLPLPIKPELLSAMGFNTF